MHTIFIKIAGILRNPWGGGIEKPLKSALVAVVVSVIFTNQLYAETDSYAAFKGTPIDNTVEKCWTSNDTISPYERNGITYYPAEGYTKVMNNKSSEHGIVNGYSALMSAQIQSDPHTVSKTAGIKFCPSQIDAINADHTFGSGENKVVWDRKDLYLASYGNPTYSTACIWLCADGYIGAECKQIREGNIIYSDEDKDSRDINTTYWDIDKDKKVARMKSLSLTTYDDNATNIVYGNRKGFVKQPNSGGAAYSVNCASASSGNTSQCGKNDTCYSEHIYFYVITKITESGHGAMVAQAGIRAYSVVNGKYDTGTIQSTAPYLQLFTNDKLVCMPGYHPNNSETDCIAYVNPIPCGDLTKPTLENDTTDSGWKTIKGTGYQTDGYIQCECSTPNDVTTCKYKIKKDNGTPKLRCAFGYYGAEIVASNDENRNLVLSGCTACKNPVFAPDIKKGVTWKWSGTHPLQTEDSCAVESIALSNISSQENCSGDNVWYNNACYEPFIDSNFNKFIMPVNTICKY